jgi:hypothetical protein
MTQTTRGFIALALFLTPLISSAQMPYPRTRRGSLGTAAPPGGSVPKGVIIVFKGKLKVLDKKKIVIETGEGELLTIKLTGKTKFLDGDKTVKPAAIDLETPLLVDASQDTDASLLAVNVNVDAKPGSEESAPEKTSVGKTAQDKPPAKQD